MLTLGSKMTKWLKSAMRCATSLALLSLAYDMMVPAGSCAANAARQLAR